MAIYWDMQCAVVVILSLMQSALIAAKILSKIEWIPWNSHLRKHDSVV